MTFRRRKWVAIDYDRREVRLVAYDHVRKLPSIRSLHTARIPEGVDATDAGALGRFLKPVVDKLHLGGANAVMCVGRAQAVLKSLTLPGSAEPGDLPAMVKYQAAKELPFSAEEAVVDYTRGSHWDTGQAEVAEGTTVLAAAVRLPAVEAAREICTAAGLRLHRLALRPYANLRAVYRCAQVQPGQRLLLVNVTADEAEIDVMCDEMLEFSRAATVAAPETSEELPGGARHQADAVERIVAEVSRSLQSFRAVERGGRLDQCLIAGSTGLEEALAQTLPHRLGAPCALLDLARGFAVRRDRSVSAFAAALGLAAGAPAEELPLDFLNPKRPVVPRDTRRTKALAVAAAVVFALAAMMLGTQVYGRARRGEIAKLGEENRKLKNANKKLKELHDEVQDLQQWLNEEVCWLDQLAYLSRTLPPAQQVYLESLGCSPFGSGRRREPRSGRIAISGRVKDTQVIPEFEQRLLAPGTKVSHKGTSPVPDPRGYGVRFNVDVLVPPGRAPVPPADTARPKPTGRAGGGR